MTLIATEAKRLSNVVKQELFPESAYCRAVLTATGTFVPGTVIADVNDVVLGVAMEEKSGTGAKVLSLVRGPAIVSKDGLFVGDLVAADVYAALEAKGILCNDAV
jgi:hypothetical protein